MSEAGRLWGFDGTGRYAHGGMLKAALYIRQELEQSKIMSKLFGAQRVSSNITTPLTEVKLSEVDEGTFLSSSYLIERKLWKL